MATTSAELHSYKVIATSSGCERHLHDQAAETAMLMPWPEENEP